MLKSFRKCEWIRGVYSYLPQCKNPLNHTVNYYKDMKYCPFCGRRIKYKGKTTSNVKDDKADI